MWRRRAVDKRTIRACAKRIGSALSADKIILFGSRAYGKPNPHSDVDLFVIMNSTKRPAERAAAVSELIYPRPFPVDIIVRTPREVEQRLAMGDFFVAEVLSKGQVLYDRRTG